MKKFLKFTLVVGIIAGLVIGGLKLLDAMTYDYISVVDKAMVKFYASADKGDLAPITLLLDDYSEDIEKVDAIQEEVNNHVEQWIAYLKDKFLCNSTNANACAVQLSEFENLQKQGYQRINIDGNMYQIDEIPSLNKNIKHDIEVVIDRIVIKDSISERLSQSVETALKLSNGIILVDFPETSKREIFSSKFACPVSGFTIEEIEPRLFSFNNPFGACPHCDGIGAKLYMDPNLIVPNENLNIDQGAIAPWYGFRTSFYAQAINSLCDFLNISTKTPWKDIPQKAKDIILYGSGNIPVPIYYSRFMTDKPFEGVIPNLERRFLETDSAAVREELSHYQSAAPCEFCKAKRLKPEALAVKIAGLDIMDVCNMSVKNALTWFSGIKEQLTPQKQMAGMLKQMLPEIKKEKL